MTEEPKSIINYSLWLKSGWNCIPGQEVFICVRIIDVSVFKIDEIIVLDPNGWVISQFNIGNVSQIRQNSNEFDKLTDKLIYPLTIIRPYMNVSMKVIRQAEPREFECELKGRARAS